MAHVPQAAAPAAAGESPFLRMLVDVFLYGAPPPDGRGTRVSYGAPSRSREDQGAISAPGCIADL